MRRAFRWIRRALGLALVVVLAAVLFFRFSNQRAYSIQTPNGIQESSYIQVGGIRQYVQIRGDDQANPVVLWLHGGPGEPLSYLTYAYQRPLESAYTFAYFHQRGSGRTYYANQDNGPVTDEQLLLDIDEQVDYLRNRFGQDRVIVAGEGWGTVLGTQYVAAHPEKVLAYVGVGQVVSMSQAGEHAATIAMAQLGEAGHADVAEQLGQVLARYQAATSIDDLNLDALQSLSTITLSQLKGHGALSSLQRLWLTLTSPDLGLDDLRWIIHTLSISSRYAAEHDLAQYLHFGYALAELGLAGGTPVAFVQGENDWTTPTDLVMQWFSLNGATGAGVIVVPGAGHQVYLDNPTGFARAFEQAAAGTSAPEPAPANVPQVG